MIGGDVVVVVAVAVGVAVAVVVGTGVAVVAGGAVIGAVVVAEYTVSCMVIAVAPTTTTSASKHGGEARQTANGAAAGFPNNSRDSDDARSRSRFAEARSGRSSTVNERIARARHVSSSSSARVD
jgi:hypothetical protein